MFKLVILVTIVACASAQSAAKYPAGVDPAKCPNFPICDNAALHNQAPANHWEQPQARWNQWDQPAKSQWEQPQQHWQQPAAPQWNQQPAWNAQPYQQPAPQNWNHQPAAPASSGGDKYPSGVNPQSCPNYPYCDVNVGLAQHGHNGHAARAAPLQGFTERLYPAGVNPASCPNYPEC